MNVAYWTIFNAQKGANSKAAVLRAWFDFAGRSALYPVAANKLPLASKVSFSSSKHPSHAEMLANLALGNLHPLGGYSLLAAKYPVMLSHERIKKVMQIHEATHLNTFFPVKLRADFNISSISEIRLVVPALEKMVAEVKALESHKKQLDKEYVLAREKDLFFALLLTLYKFPDPYIAKTCILTMGILTKATDDVDNSTYAADTSFINKPEVHAVLMTNDDDADDQLPPELDTGVMPTINGVRYYTAILDSGCSTNMVIRNKEWVDNFNPDCKIELTTADPSMGRTLTQGSCQINMHDFAAGGSIRHGEHSEYSM